jgi:hypothetical protein
MGQGFSRGAVEGFLEFAHAIDLLFRTLAYEESPEKDDPRQPAIPEIKLMSWREWTSANYHTDVYKKSHSAVDVLIDEYNGLGGSNAAPSLQPKTRNDATARESRQSLNRGQASLPTRVRINSLPAQYLLSSIFDVESGSKRLKPLVIVRPFKVLAIHSEEINAKMDEIERLLAINRKTQELSEIAADEGLQPDNHSEGTSGRNEESRQGDDDACPIIEHANDESSDGEPHSSRRPSFSKDMFRFDGTNLAEFDFSIIEEAANDFRCGRLRQ